MQLLTVGHDAFFFFSSRRRHTRYWRDWSSDVCSSDLFEAGEPLDQAHIGKYSPAHPRCGTAFLLLVVAISILLFALIPSDDWLVRIASRILGIPVIAGIAYEVLKLGGAHAEHPLMRLIVAPGLALQALTTRYPEPDMIEVAIASFQEVHRLEQESAPTEPAPPTESELT